MNLDCQMQVVFLKTLCNFLFKNTMNKILNGFQECRDMTLQKC